MSDIAPVVRVMILCEDIVTDPRRPTRTSLDGIIDSVHSNAGFPATIPQLCVFVQMAGGRGAGVARIVCVHADSGADVFYSAEHRMTFGLNPLEVRTLAFRILDAQLPFPGLFLIQFRYNDVELASLPLTASR